MEHPSRRDCHGRRAATHPPLVVAREGLGGVIPSLLAAVPAAVLPSLVWSANPADNGLDCGTVARPAPADTVPPGNRQERSCRLVGRPRRPSRPRAPPPRRQERRGGGGGPAISAPGRQRGAARRAAPDGSGLAVGTVPCRTGPTRTPLPRPPPGTGAVAVGVWSAASHGQAHVARRLLARQTAGVMGRLGELADAAATVR